MCFFKKKKKKFQYSQYNMNAGKDNVPSITSFDKISYMLISENSDDLLFAVCDKVLSGHPVLVKFENIEIGEANRMLSFMAGVVYATYGKMYKIESRLFLLGRKEEFEDGSLYQYIEDLK